MHFPNKCCQHFLVGELLISQMHADEVKLIMHCRMDNSKKLEELLRLQKCPSCGGDVVRRQINLEEILFCCSSVR
jgi:hypothetical protein